MVLNYAETRCALEMEKNPRALLARAWSNNFFSLGLCGRGPEATVSWLGTSFDFVAEFRANSVTSL